MIHITGNMNGLQDLFSDDETITSLTSEDFLIICGKLGFILYDRNTIAGIIENAFLDELEQKPFTILFVDSANENFDLLNAYPVEMWNGGKIHRIRKNIAHLMRGQVFTIEGKKIFTMGGGRPGRPEDYVSEMKTDVDAALPTKTELEEGWNNLVKHNLNVDIVVSYLATAEAITIGRSMAGRKVYAGDLFPFFEKITEEIRYKVWYMGWDGRDLKAEISRGRHPLGEYCIKKRMYPVGMKTLKIDLESLENS